MNKLIILSIILGATSVYARQGLNARCFETQTVFEKEVEKKLIFKIPNPGEKYKYWMSAEPAIMANGAMVVGSLDGNVYFLNPDGSQKAVFKTQGPVHHKPIIMANGTVVVGSADGKVYFLKPDGSQKTVFKTQDKVLSQPVIMSNGTVVVGSMDGNTYFLNPDGSLKDVFNTGPISADLAIMTDDTAVVSSWTGIVHFFYPDGSTKKSAAKGDGEAYNSPAILANGTVVVGSEDGNFYCLNRDGSEKAVFKNLQKNKSTSGYYSTPAIMADDTVVVGNHDGTVYILNPDCSKKATFKTESSVASSPAIMADGTVVVGSYGSGTIYFLNTDGSVVANLRLNSLGGEVLSSQPIIMADGTVIVGTVTGSVYSLKLKNTDKKKDVMAQVDCPKDNKVKKAGVLDSSDRSNKSDLTPKGGKAKNKTSGAIQK